MMQFYLENVKCSKCLHKIDDLLAREAAVESYNVNLGQRVLQLQLVPSGHFGPIAEKLDRLGFAPHPIQNSNDTVRLQRIENRSFLMKVAVAAGVSANIMLFAVSIYAGAPRSWEHAFNIISAILFLPVIFYSAIPFYKNAWTGIKNKQASIDLPILASIIGGTIISYYHTAIGNPNVYFDSMAMLVFLLLAARYYLRTLQQNYLSPSFLKSFFNIQRAKVWSKKTQSYCFKPAQEIKAGDKLTIEPNEVFPVDGRLMSPSALIDASVLTGESRPQSLVKEATCFAGTKNLAEQIEITALNGANDSRLGRLLKQVEDQLLAKTPLTSMTDKFAQYFTVTIMLVGLSYFLLHFQSNFTDALNRSLALILLACPCALAFATPLAQSLSLMKLAESGILVKKAEVFEKLCAAKNVVFDKTGTLTEGRFEFLGWRGRDPEVELQSIVYGLELNSLHPIAKTLCLYLESRAPKVEIQNSKEVVGQGVFGEYQGHTYAVKSAPSSFESQHTTIGVYKDDVCVAVAELDDILKPDAESTIRKITELGINTYILSGDSVHPVQNISRTLGLEEAYAIARLSPEEKLNWIEKHPQSVMVGDGANDLLAFSNSLVSVAVKGSMEASLRTADIFLTRPGVRPIYDLIMFSRETMKIIKRALIFSVIYNSLGATAALMGYINPLVAAILMPVSSVIVVSMAVSGTHWIRQYEGKPA